MSGVPVPSGTWIHLQVEDDLAACERAGRDWDDSGDFYLTAADSPLAHFIDCPYCVEQRDAQHDTTTTEN